MISSSSLSPAFASFFNPLVPVFTTLHFFKGLPISTALALGCFVEADVAAEVALALALEALVEEEEVGAVLVAADATEVDFFGEALMGELDGEAFAAWAEKNEEMVPFFSERGCEKLKRPTFSGDPSGLWKGKLTRMKLGSSADTFPTSNETG